jgi:hypothetical protein
MKFTRQKTILAVGLLIAGVIAVALAPASVECLEPWNTPYSATFPGKRSEVSSPHAVITSSAYVRHGVVSKPRIDSTSAVLDSRSL